MDAFENDDEISTRGCLTFLAILFAAIAMIYLDSATGAKRYFASRALGHSMGMIVLRVDGKLMSVPAANPAIFAMAKDGSCVTVKIAEGRWTSGLASIEVVDVALPSDGDSIRCPAVPAPR